MSIEGSRCLLNELNVEDESGRVEDVRDEMEGRSEGDCFGLNRLIGRDCEVLRDDSC